MFTGDLPAHLPIHDPTWIFFLVLCIILFAPMLLERLHIPHIIGMVLFGVAVGPYGFHVVERDMSFELFGQVGLYYILFIAGLGMDLSGLKRNLSKSVLFGFLTFIVPFVGGGLVAYYGLHYSMMASLLLASILSSHTLVAYPIVTRYGLTKHISVTLSVGATMLALVAALLVVAGISGFFSAESGVLFWGALALKCVLFCVGICVIYPFLIRHFFRLFADNVLQYIFVLALVFLAAGVSQYCGLQGIFGAFLAGVVLNRFIPDLSPLMNRINFVGNALFIPYFLIGVGMLINIRLLFEKPEEIFVILLIVVTATFTKWMAAGIMRRVCRLDRASGLMMFGLTQAHAAGGLAMVMVGTQLMVAPGQYLMNDEVLNAVVMLILFTCIISSLATNTAARSLVTRIVSREEKTPDDNVTLISLASREMAEPLVQMALLMRNPHSNKPLIGVHVVLDGEDTQRKKAAGVQILKEATHIASAADVRMKSGVRVATNVASALIHSVKEYDVSTLLVGLHRKQRILDKFFGSTVEALFKGMNRQIAIVRSVAPVGTLRQIQVLTSTRAELELGFTHWAGCMARLALQLDCPVTFHGTPQCLEALQKLFVTKYANIKASYLPQVVSENYQELVRDFAADHLLVIITARRGSVSYHNSAEQLPYFIEKYFSNNNIMVIYPEQAGGENAQRTSFHAGLSEEDAYANLHLHPWMEERIQP